MSSDAAAPTWRSTPDTEDIYRTTIEYWQADEGVWRATERDGDDDLKGQGADPREAVIDYVVQLQERDRDE